MEGITQILPIAQVVLAVLISVAVLLQQSDAGLGTVLGGTESLANFHSRRGFEKVLFISTFVLVALFVLLGVLNILYVR